MSETSTYAQDFFLRDDLRHTQLVLLALLHRRVKSVKLTRKALSRLIFILGRLAIDLAFMSHSILSHLGQSPICKL